MLRYLLRFNYMNCSINFKVTTPMFKSMFKCFAGSEYLCLTAFIWSLQNNFHSMQSFKTPDASKGKMIFATIKMKRLHRVMREWDVKKCKNSRRGNGFKINCIIELCMDPIADMPLTHSVSFCNILIHSASIFPSIKWKQSLPNLKGLVWINICMALSQC